MTSGGRFLCLFVVALQVGSDWTCDAADGGKADELVQLALQAELAGDNPGRQAKLAEAIHSFPEHASSRWHSGFVMIDGNWLAVDEAELQATQRGLVDQYRRLRDRYAETAAGQVALARWCRQNKLADQERLHWLAVLGLDPSHSEARSRLGVREYRGALLTKDQIARYEAYQKAHDQAFDEWKPRLVRLRNAIEGTDDTAREAALVELRAIDDEQVIPALENVLSEAEETAALAAVEILGRIKGDVATASLIRHAVLSEYERVRQAAADQLRTRSWYSYVPVMLAELQAPVELAYFVQTFQGGIQYGYELVQDRPEGTYTHERRHSILLTAGVSTPSSRRQSVVPFDAARSRSAARTRYKQDSRLLAEFAGRTDDANRQSAALNELILTTLRRATGQQLSDDPRDWWQWWADQNELYQQRQVHHSKTATAQLLVARVAPVCSCFLPGTLVWTDTGTVPIEKVRIGDRVLSQNQETGELAYKLVMDTTIRPPSPTLRLGLGDEEIVSTLGHPLWVTGQGWLMAKEVEVGDRLHGVHGSQVIDYIKPGPESEAFNLVVADFSTYFVGRHRILVHDNQPRLVAEASLPGK